MANKASPENLAEINRILSALVGAKVAKVRYEEADFIRLEFAPKGSGHFGRLAFWRFANLSSAWRVETDLQGTFFSGGLNPQDLEDLSFVIADEKKLQKTLENKIVVSAELDLATLRLAITFAGNLTLRLSPETTERYTHWMFTTPEDQILEFGPARAWTYRPRATPDR